MSCLGPYYLPVPPRVWSRVENPCAYTNSIQNIPGDYIYLPYLNDPILKSQYYYQLACLKKGNVLQYKANSSNLTKQQRYAQIAKGMWVNRTTTWASQSETTSDPNTKSLKRVNYFNITTGGVPTVDPLTCSLPVRPTNSVLPPRSGSSNAPALPPPPQENQPGGPVMPPPVSPAMPVAPIVIANGGSLVCNVTQNICTGEILKVTETNQCFLTTASDVPGRPVLLCYNDNLPTVYPKSRLTYPDAGGKWPQGAKLIAAANTTTPIPSNNLSVVNTSISDSNTITGSNPISHIQSENPIISPTSPKNPIFSFTQLENTIISAIKVGDSNIVQQINQFTSNLDKNIYTSINNVFNNTSEITPEAVQLSDIVTTTTKTVKLYLDNKFIDLDNKLTAVNTSLTTLQSNIGSMNTSINNIETTTTSHSEMISNIQAAITNHGEMISNILSKDAIHTLAISDTVTEIMEYYSKFAVGNFYSVSNSMITENSFNRLTLQLEELQKSELSNTSDYEIIRHLIVTSFQSVYALITQNVIYRNTLMNYDKLYNAIISTFKTYIIEFNTKQQNSDLFTIFTIEEQIRLGQLLISNNFNPTFNFTDAEITSFIHSENILSAYETTNIIFDDYRNFIYLLIDTLNTDINIISLNKTLINTNVSLENYKNILTDVDKLKEYIEQNYKNLTMSLINVDLNLNTQLAIKPEYLIYIQLYGIPENGIFESNKLYTIIYNIANNIPQ